MGVQILPLLIRATQSNTPKQILLHQALETPMMPKFGHIPLIHGPDGSKLSKRHGAASVQDYREQGYLPAALNHYLMMLSWLPGDEMSPISMAEAAKKFDISKIKKGAATFDAQKLAAVNAAHIKAAENAELINQLSFENPLTDTQRHRLLVGLDDLKPRAKTLLDLATAAAFYTQEVPLTMEEKAQAALSEGKLHVQNILNTLENETDWSTDTLSAVVNTYAESADIQSFKEIGMPLRAALSGQAGGPSATHIMVALGKEETLKRLQAAIA